MLNIVQKKDYIVIKIILSSTYNKSQKIVFNNQINY